MTGPDDSGPFFHGTRAALGPGELLTAGYVSNYRPEVTMNHVYFTSLVDGAGLAAEVAALGPDSDSPRGEPHVYEVEPLGDYVDDPNVTDKKFPGNPTRSFRSTEPLRIVHEITDWKRLSEQDLQMWRERLAAIREDDDKQILN